MKRKFNIVLFLSLSIILLNCDNSSNVVDSALPKYDLTVGNSWIYSTNMFNSEGVVTKHFTIYRKIIRETTFVGEKWLIISEDTVSTSSRISKLFRESTEGYYEHSTYYNAQLGQSRDTTLLIYKYPAPLNTQYFVNPSYQVDGSIYSDTTKIISRNAKMNVPAGGFNCYMYKTIQNMSSRDSLGNIVFIPFFWKNDYLSEFGVVKMEVYSLITVKPTLIISSELVSYTKK